MNTTLKGKCNPEQFALRTYFFEILLDPEAFGAGISYINFCSNNIMFLRRMYIENIPGDKELDGKTAKIFKNYQLYGEGTVR